MKSVFPVQFLLILCIAILRVLPVFSADSIQEGIPAEMKGSLEVLPFSATDTIGLLGFHYDMHPFPDRSCYFGLGGYGSIYGDEGGFFAMGGTLGYKLRLDERLTIDTGLFIGGGGGADRVFGGGGLMTRLHVTGDFRLGRLSWFAGLAYTEFPDTPNPYHDDLHVVAGMKLHDFDWQSKTWESESGKRKAEIRNSINIFDGDMEQWRIVPAVIMYRTLDERGMNRDGTFTGSGDENSDFLLMGVQIDNSMTRVLYRTFEVYGAYGGGADGYAAFFGGLGTCVNISDSLFWDTRGLLGLGGDSRLDTGSGMMAQLCTGLRAYFTENCGIKTSIGRIRAIDGRFESNTFDLGLFLEAAKPRCSSRKAFRFPSETYTPVDWSISLTNKTYLPDSDSFRDDGSTYHSVQHLLGLVLNKPVTGWLTLSGSTHWAYEGNIGSYAEGMFGATLHPAWMLFGPVQTTVTAEYGVAGGGNTDVDSGRIAQAAIGAEIPLSKNLSLELRAGKMQSTGGTFKADTIQLRLNWKQKSLFKGPPCQEHRPGSNSG